MYRTIAHYALTAAVVIVAALCLFAPVAYGLNGSEATTQTDTHVSEGDDTAIDAGTYNCETAGNKLCGYVGHGWWVRSTLRTGHEYVISSDTGPIVVEDDSVFVSNATARECALTYHHAGGYDPTDVMNYCATSPTQITVAFDDSDPGVVLTWDGSEYMFS